MNGDIQVRHVRLDLERVTRPLICQRQFRDPLQPGLTEMDIILPDGDDARAKCQHKS